VTPVRALRPSWWATLAERLEFCNRRDRVVLTNGMDGLVASSPPFGITDVEAEFGVSKIPRKPPRASGVCRSRCLGGTHAGASARVLKI